MSPESAPRALATARLEKAQALLEDAKLLFSVGQWASANNRAYYCLSLGYVLTLLGLTVHLQCRIVEVFRSAPGRIFLNL